MPLFDQKRTQLENFGKLGLVTDRIFSTLLLYANTFERYQKIILP
jgi:hypothetical protein